MVEPFLPESRGTPRPCFAAFLYFDLSFMVWVLLGPLGVAIAKDFGLTPAQKGLMVAVPVLSGALLRLVNGVLVDRIGPKKTGIIGQLIVIAGLVAGLVPGRAQLSPGAGRWAWCWASPAASFAVALPLASRWYPPEHQGLALGIAGAGNSGTALAALFAPGLAKAYGWHERDGPGRPPAGRGLRRLPAASPRTPRTAAGQALAEYLAVLKTPATPGG